MTRLEHATVGVCGRVRAVLSTGETLLLGPAGAALEISGPATTAATTATTTRLLAPLVPPSARLAPAVAAALRLRNACCPHLPPATAPCLAAPVPAEGYENDDGAVPEDTDGAAPVGPPAGPRRLGFPVTRVTWPTTVALAAAGLRPGDAAVGDVEEAVVPCELAPAAAAKRAAVRHAAFSRLLSLGLACPLPGGGWRVTTACGRCWAAVGPGLLDAWAEYPLFVDAPAPAPPPPTASPEAGASSSISDAGVVAAGSGAGVVVAQRQRFSTARPPDWCRPGVACALLLSLLAPDDTAATDGDGDSGGDGEISALAAEARAARAWLRGAATAWARGAPWASPVPAPPRSVTTPVGAARLDLPVAPRGRRSGPASDADGAEAAWGDWWRDSGRAGTLPPDVGSPRGLDASSQKGQTMADTPPPGAIAAEWSRLERAWTRPLWAPPAPCPGPGLRGCSAADARGAPCAPIFDGLDDSAIQAAALPSSCARAGAWGVEAAVDLWGDGSHLITRLGGRLGLRWPGAPGGATAGDWPGDGWPRGFSLGLTADAGPLHWASAAGPPRRCCPATGLALAPLLSSKATGTGHRPGLVRLGPGARAAARLRSDAAAREARRARAALPWATVQPQPASRLLTSHACRSACLLNPSPHGPGAPSAAASASAASVAHARRYWIGAGGYRSAYRPDLDGAPPLDAGARASHVAVAWTSGSADWAEVAGGAGSEKSLGSGDSGRGNGGVVVEALDPLTGRYRLYSDGRAMLSRRSIADTWCILSLPSLHPSPPSSCRRSVAAVFRCGSVVHLPPSPGWLAGARGDGAPPDPPWGPRWNGAQRMARVWTQWLRGGADGRFSIDGGDGSGGDGVAPPPATWGGEGRHIWRPAAMADHGARVGDGGGGGSTGPGPPDEAALVRRALEFRLWATRSPAERGADLGRRAAAEAEAGRAAMLARALMAAARS